MIKGLNESSNELGELAAGSEEAEERYLSPDLIIICIIHNRHHYQDHHCHHH